MLQARGGRREWQHVPPTGLVDSVGYRKRGIIYGWVKGICQGRSYEAVMRPGFHGILPYSDWSSKLPLRDMK